MKNINRWPARVLKQLYDKKDFKWFEEKRKLLESKWIII
jgi:hypothetical protein